MRFGDAPRQRQAEAESGRAAAHPFAAKEGIEDARQIRFGNARPVVADGEHRLRTVAPGLDLDALSVAVFARVVEEIVEQLNLGLVRK